MLRVSLALGALVLLGAASVGFAATRLNYSAPSGKLAGTVVWPAGARPAPGFALHDQNGQRFTPAVLRGHTWVITFLDSRCTASCPIVARDLATAQRMLGPSSSFPLLVVSVLPKYDTPAHVRTFAHKVGLVHNWHWLLGTRRRLAPVWQRYGIWVETGITHDIAVYIVDCAGDVRVADAQPVVPSQVASSVRALQRQACIGSAART